MKRLGIFVLVGALTAPAMADLVHGDRALAPIIAPSSSVEIGQPADLRGTPVYDSMGPGTGGYWAFSPTMGPLGQDDYGTISGVNITSMQWVGGMTAPSGVLWFEFYDPTTYGFVTSFGLQVPTSGAYIWTISFGTPFVIPHTAIMQIVANTTYTPVPTTIAGQWFMTTFDALTVGLNNTAFGGGTTTYGASLLHCFRFDVPEPAAIALLGLGVLGLIRRRQIG